MPPARIGRGSEIRRHAKDRIESVSGLTHNDSGRTEESDRERVSIRRASAAQVIVNPRKHRAEVAKANQIVVCVSNNDARNVGGAGRHNEKGKAI